MIGEQPRLHRANGPVFALLALTAALASSAGVHAWDDPANRDGAATNCMLMQDDPRPRIGQILLSGNQTLPPRALLALVPLFPGATFAPEDLRIAERSLARSALFEIGGVDDPSPSVLLLKREDQSENQDILISVREKSDARNRWILLTALRAAAAAWAHGLPAGIAEVMEP